MQIGTKKVLNLHQFYSTKKYILESLTGQSLYSGELILTIYLSSSYNNIVGDYEYLWFFINVISNKLSH